MRDVLFSLYVVAAGSRKKKLSNTTLDSSLLRLLLLGFFLKLTIAPVGMWKSGAGWANRWAGVFLPVHGFVHALEPRSARQGRFPHIHRAHRCGMDAAKKRPPGMADSSLRRFAIFRQTAIGGASRGFLSKSKRKRSALASRAGRKSKSPPGPGRR